ncbi:tetratricopeptide repeat protein [Ideonella sp. 4Y11]|uniref:Tetratricopeptide repeat protein n=1 Tax=Ideonella aquatica TaxID=2824119 RepID=A0A940YI90_9BURK|nr:tetratricopeptide repeat protein [Ideonella aquatica]MBQ0960738.1 tetratricopeptide repeat protein [Ideonella aquatica]
MAQTPRFAPAHPLDYFSSLVAEGSEIALLEAAILLAQDDHPTLDVQAVLDEIDQLADRLRQRLPADAPPAHRLRMLNRFFFRELGFAGNVNDYHHADNSYLHRVLQTRRGIPISLALLYIEIAQQIGLTARGISFPGHFLVKLRLPAGEVVVDPFTGESLSRDRLAQRLAPWRQQLGLPGDDELPLGLFLQTAEPREVLARMLRNLKAVHERQGDLARQLAVQQRLVRLLPGDWDERRDRGLLLAELGSPGEALVDLQTCLDQRPEGPQAELLRQRMAELRGRPRP